MVALERLCVVCARLGLCSRSEATRYARLGLVAVDGKPVLEPAALVPSTATVTLLDRGRRVQANKVTIMLHKPLHYAACRAPAGTPLARRLLVPENRATSCRTRHDPRRLSKLDVADVLDEASTGVLVFSQDGRVATRVARDASTEKEYRVQLAGASGSVTSSQLAALSECLGVVSKDEGDSEPVTGFTAGGGVYGTSVELLEPEEDSEGQHRDLLRVVVCGQLPATHIRRTCGLAGLRPEAVVRTRIGRLSLGDLPVGQWTVVSSHDIL
eukprot:gnl/TRDRNA2_/TRDRNA2_145060_c0_seq4.p1 gnl/TRDRNA2_/TRDRNA2_145060_c0~~gnl/TRDRNA2_/TRDRNA2_145060_c0_seq4.p1  ORF type:complete len:270 (+),score=29.09 gnl/TRDRNA2_/TRDRNA2_145060_c0_seq4:66-875(+)